MSVILFGIRHLSPGGSYHLLKLLDKEKPNIILVEGPSDFTEKLKEICNKKTKPPIAIMAYSQIVPIKTILYPFADYSPEYQAIRWADKHKIPCRFIDLPSEVFIAIGSSHNKREEEEERIKFNVYEKMAELSSEENQETFWERNFEHNTGIDTYQNATLIYGKKVREFSDDTKIEWAENNVREAYMKRQIENAINEGFKKIVVVTGAFHTEGLTNDTPTMTEEEIKILPRIAAKKTWMPYSYYRLSERAGYGAGNKAPAYYNLLWNSLKAEKPENTGYQYLTMLAAYQRKYGNLVSSAEVIEAVRLSKTLANMKGYEIPALQDLRDSAVTCMGHGHLSEISMAVADTEIGTVIGELPEGISSTSIQEDYNRLMKDLKLEKYKTMVSESLSLDLRENTRVKSEKSAFLDLERSFFLHRLEELSISFCKKVNTNQDNATWAENWVLQWSPESEIEMVESALKGETIEFATAYVLKEEIECCESISQAARVMEKACLCGIPNAILSATKALQGLAVDSNSLLEIAETANSLSFVIRYGSIRKLPNEPFIPILQQLFFRACLMLVNSCSCDNKVIQDHIQAVQLLNEVSINHDFVEGERWIEVLTELSDRDDVNTKASGFATAILLERGKITNQLLSEEVERRLSKGIPADLGAGWFEGLSMKNKYSLITRLSLWEKLNDYISTLDDEEFKRALVFLRRSFSEFSSNEKNNIAENLGEVWGLNTTQTSDILNREITEEEKEVLAELDDFDFGDI